LAPATAAAPPVRPLPDNPWHPAEPDGTFRPVARRPPAPVPGTWQEVLPNGTVRVHRATLDGDVQPGAPAAAFPSRWSRSLLDPGAVYYPRNWTPSQLRHHVTTALADPVLRREANGVHYRLGRSGGVWIEGMYLPDGGFLGHRPDPYQSIQHPRYSDPATLTAGRGAEVRPPGLGPVRVRRDLMFDGSETLQITVRVKPVGDEDAPIQDKLRVRADLDQAVREFLAGPHEGGPATGVRVEFTQDADAAEVRVVPGQDLTVQQVLPRLHERVAAEGPAAVLAALKEQAPAPPETVSGDAPMLAGLKALFDPAVWDGPTLGRHLPKEWSANEARYAAGTVAASADRVPAGPVPPGGTTAPELRHGSFAGVKLTVRVENGLITDFWSRPDQRMPEQLAKPVAERPQVLGTHRVRPPKEAFERSMELRAAQRFTVSRIRHADGDTESLVTVRIHLDTGRLNLADQQTAKSFKELTARVRTGVSETYDIGQRLPSGDRLRVRVEFVDDPRKAHHTVAVHPKQDREDSANWGLATKAVTAAHEIGHLLGLADEYRERSDGTPPRPVYLDGGLMGPYIRDRFNRPVADMDNLAGGPVNAHPRPVLRARNLRQLGNVIDQAFGADRGPGPESTLPPRPRLNADALRLALHGDLTRASLREPGAGRDGGGHLFPPPGSDDPRPTRIPGSENRNGTFRVLGGPADGVDAGHRSGAGDLDTSAAVRARGRTMFPEHWSADDAAYAAEQAYQHARRRGDGAFTEAGPDSWSWTGEYGGVRIEGRIQVRTEQGPRGPVQVAEIVSFRPSHDQGGLGPAPHLPWHPFPDAFDQRAADVLRYGDRLTLSGVHHQPPNLAGEPGTVAREARVAGERSGIKIGPPSAPHPNGTYRATVWYLDPAVNPAAPMARFDSRWFKRTDHAVNTFYPAHWRPVRVLDAVDSAYAGRDRSADRVVNGAVHWSAVGDGVRIEGITRDGRHVAHRPADEQPGVARRAGAPTSPPLTEPGPPGTGRRPAVTSGMPPGTVPADVFSPDLSSAAGRGLPAEWTAQEQRHAVHKGRKAGDDTPLDGGGTRGKVVFAGVEITVVRDADGKVTDYSVADGHTPPPQLDVRVPERGSRKPKAPEGADQPPRAPFHPDEEDGSDTDSRRGEDEDQDGDGYEDGESDGDMSEVSRADTMDLILEDEPMDWDGGFGDGNRATGHMDVDEPLPREPRPAHQAPAPDLRFAALRDPVEVGAPADPARHTSDSTFLRRFQVTRGVLVDGSPAAELVVRLHLDTSPVAGTPGRDPALQNLQERARQGIDEYFNTGHRLPNGEVLVVRVEFVDDPGRAHHRVEVFEGPIREVHTRWALDTERRVLAHEFGHLLGLPDEYRERRVRRTEADANGATVVVEEAVHPRFVSADGSLMGSSVPHGGRLRLDQDAGVVSDEPDLPVTLASRNLRELGRAVEDALGPVPAAPPVHGLPRRAAFGEDALRTSTFGDTRNPGGHLLPPGGSDRTAPGHVVRVERNGVVVADFSAETAATLPRPRRLDSASAAADDLIVAGTGRRRMFPRNWTSEDAAYAAEQAYLHALGTGNVVPLGGSRYRWTGEYAGVRIEGEIRAGEFLSFRPSDRQPDVDPPLNAPHRPAPDDPERGFGTFGQRAEDIARYGDRQHLTGLHHELDLDQASAASALRAHGARIVETSAPIHNGTYRARAAFLDPTVAPTSPLADFPTRWRFRATGTGRTMYPHAWTTRDVVDAVDRAHDSVPAERRVYRADGRTYHWAGEAFGVRVEGLSRDGLHLAHRPSDVQPMAEWQPRRVVGTSPDTRLWLGVQPLSVARVLFDSGQEGLRITVPVRTVVQGQVPAHLPGLARAEMQRRVDEFVQQRMREAAGPDGVPPRLVTVRLDFDPPHGEVFSSMVLRPDDLSNVESLLGPLVVENRQHVFAARAEQLSPLATPVEQLIAVHGGPRVPTDLREPGPLRPGEQTPAVVPGWDQQTVRRLAAMDVRFSEEAAAADPRTLPADRSLPHEWSALDSRWAALRVLEDHESRHGATVSEIVRGTVGGVTVEVRVEDAQIVRVTGVGDQRELPQLHVPPFVPDSAVHRHTLTPAGPRPGPSAWQSADLDGTVTGAPRRPPAPAGDQLRTPLPGGAVRIAAVHLDPAVGQGAPAAQFPTRWHRSALDPGTVYYPEHWGAAELAAHVTAALDHPVLTRHEDDGSRLVLGESEGVWIEGRFGPDGTLYYHRPAPYQGHDNPDYRGAAATTARRGEDVEPNGLGPVRLRRDLMFDGSEVMRITARVRLVGGEDTTGADLRRAEAALRASAEEYLEGHQAGSTTRLELRLEFTGDADAAEVRIVPGQDPTVEQALPRLHEAAGTDRLAEVLTSEQQPQAPAAPRTVAGEAMLDGRRRFFAAAAWNHPTEGRNLPREWTADEARYAASVVAGSPHRVLAGPVPPGGTHAPELVHGSFGGVRMAVRTENGRITDFWGQPDQRTPQQLTRRGPEPHEVLGTHEVRPPTDAFDHALESREFQRFSVTRIRHADGDTEAVVTLRLHLDTSRLNLSDPHAVRRLNDLVNRARAGLAETYNGDQRLPSGDRLRVRAEFVHDPAGAHRTVTVHPGPIRVSHEHWDLRTETVVLVHEMGHHLGLPDEYRESRSRLDRRRQVHLDGGLMSSHIRDRYGRTEVDTNYRASVPGVVDARPVLRARNLWQLGSVIDRAFGADRGPAGDGVHPPRPRVNGDARRLALYGDLNGTGRQLSSGARDGGGHLFPPPGSDRPQPARIPGSENRNGTFRVFGGPADGVDAGHRSGAGDLDTSAAVRARGRTMFPEHWSADDAVYAAEQAYQHALRRGPGAFTPLGRNSWSWTGEYGGVRIEGQVDVLARRRPGGRLVDSPEIVSFRPADDQSGLGVASHLPWHPFPSGFGQRVGDLVRYGNRQTLTGVHHQPPERSWAGDGDVSRVDQAGQRQGIRIGTPFAAHPNGTYRAQVWYLDPVVSPRAPMEAFPSRWHVRADDQSHVFYPRDWQADHVLEAVEEAHHNRDRAEDRRVNGAVHWTGVTNDGIRIEGITRDGRHLIHRPADEQPGTVLPPDAPRSAPLTEPTGPGAGRRPATISAMSLNPVPATHVSPDLRADAGRGLPREWTAEERLFAAANGRQIGDRERVGDDFRVRVRFAEVEITVLRDDRNRIVDFSLADGHTPPPQLTFLPPERGTGRPVVPTPTERLFSPQAPRSEDGSLPRTPGYDEGVWPTTPGGDGGSLPRTPGYDGGSLPRTPGYDEGVWPTTPGGDGGSLPRTPGYDGGSLPRTPGYDEGVWPTTPGGDGGSLPRTPGYDGGSLPRTPGYDEAMDLHRRSEDEEMAYDRDADDVEMESVHDASDTRSDAGADTRSMDVDPDPDAAPRQVRPAHEAPAPDLAIARVLRTVEVEAPADRSLHTSSATRHRAFEANRVVLLDGRPAVELVVRVHLDTSGLPAGEDHTTALRRLRRRARRGVDEYYNTGHRLPDGDALVVRVEFVDDPDRAHHEVEVRTPAPGERIREHSGLWGLDTDRTVLAHELGHLLGLPDEYRERRVRLETTDEDGDPDVVGEIRPRASHLDGTLMGGTHAGNGRVRFDQDAGIVPDDTDIRFALAPRHLRELGRAVEDAFGPAPTAPVVYDLPSRASFGRDALQTSTFGDTRNPGGHLLPPTGSDRTAPGHVVRVERNGVVVAD
ncbi:EndoU domain-containing protein, partial [Kitasatospora putterlickiae]|uniref:EndoU domain-containing protein n=1 Tax=Kitasatospora putterlickiae TaxID=221725 RepID=UPI0031CF7CD8